MSDYETLLVRTAHAVMTVTLSNPPITAHRRDPTPERPPV
jgi:hypothetical protein